MDQRELAIITRLRGCDIMTLVIFNAQETEADPKGHYEVRVKFMHDFQGWTESKNYERIHEAFREIRANDIVWNFLGEDRTTDGLRCPFLVTLGIFGRSGLIRYKLHPELLPIIPNPSLFAKLKLIMLTVLAQPKYGYPLYEFVADFGRGCLWRACQQMGARRPWLLRRGLPGVQDGSEVAAARFSDGEN